MDGNKYLKDLCDLATVAGATVHIDLNETAFAEGRRVISRVTVAGVPGIGPHPMGVVAAVERLSIAKSQGHFGPVIESAEISPMPRPLPEGILDPMPTVTAKFSDGQTRSLFTFYPDEIVFEPTEFVGLTLAEAKQLKAQKDRNFLTEKDDRASRAPVRETGG